MSIYVLCGISCHAQSAYSRSRLAYFPPIHLAIQVGYSPVSLLLLAQVMTGYWVINDSRRLRIYEPSQSISFHSVKTKNTSGILSSCGRVVAFSYPRYLCRYNGSLAEQRCNVRNLLDCIIGLLSHSDKFIFVAQHHTLLK
jgi:hypothetical protein